MKKISYICDCCNKEIFPSNVTIIQFWRNSENISIHTFPGGIDGHFDVCPSCVDKIYKLHFKKEDKNDSKRIN